MSVGEIRELLSWIGDPPRSPQQTHGLNESDSEVLDLGNGTYLAATIDTISEEIEAGIYQDPYRIGWVAAMASLSDLAAVGARPLGMLLSAEWGAQQEAAAKAGIARGFSEALRRAGTFWLGGDTGRGRSTTLGGVALGLCESRPLSRMGVMPGDWMCVTGQLGIGPALALRFLRGESNESFPESHYLPVARLEAGQALRDIAHAAMDTSDGLVQTMHTLLDLNGAGLELRWAPELISEPARKYCKERDIPLWTLWVAEHGDYQLVLSIAPENLEKAKASVPDLHVLGQVVRERGMRMKFSESRTEAIDPHLARSLLKANNHDVSKALNGLIEIFKERGFP